MAGFTVSGGKIFDPQGHQWRAYGIGTYDDDTTGNNGGVGASLLIQQWATLLPGLNCVRIACYAHANGIVPDRSAADLAPFIDAITAKGIVVWPEHHAVPSNGNSPLTGTNLQRESAWYASLASRWINNPYVWFGTMNEPGGSDDAQILATYNAIRGTGNTMAIVLCEAGPGADGNNIGSVDTSKYVNMRNAIWDAHFYAWEPDPSGHNADQATTNAKLLSNVNQFNNASNVHTLDGAMPVLNGECGNSTDGTNLDGGGNKIIPAVALSTANAGFCAWIWNQGNQDEINNMIPGGLGQTSPKLGVFGSQVAQYVNANPSPPGTGGTPVTNIIVNSPSPNPTAGNTFTIAGSMTNYSSNPVLNYADDGSTAFTALPSGFTESTSAFSFLHPGMQNGPHTVSVRDANIPSIIGTTPSFTIGNTSNIHYNLTPWATSHAYSSVGARVSNSGNAYQLITAGTSASSGGPTTNAASITDGTAVWKYLSHIDFTSLQSWANALPTTLSQPVVAQLWNNGPITTTSGVAYLILGTGLGGGGTAHNTSATNTITITCAPGESFRDKGAAIPLAINTANGVTFVEPASGVAGVDYFNITDSNIIIDGFQFLDPNPNSASTFIGMELTTCNNIKLRNCIFDAYSQSSSGGAYIVNNSAASDDYKMMNCVIIDRQPTNGSQQSVAIDGSGACINCTFIAVNGGITAPGCAISYKNAATNYARNCTFHGYVAPIKADAGSPSIDHCCTSASSFGLSFTDAGGNILNTTAANQFVSPTTDFRLKSGSVCINAGTTDTTDIPVSDDIVRTTRPQGTTWDIGAFEFVSQTSIGVNTPVTQTVGIPFTISGTLVNYSSNPTLNYADDSGTFSALPSGFSESTTSFSFAHPGNLAAGNHTVTVRDANITSIVGTSAAFTVNPVVSVQVNTPSNVVAGSTFTVSGTLTGYSTTPTLNFADDGGAFSVLPSGFTVSTTAFSFTHQSVIAGNHTTVVRDANNTGNSGSTNTYIASVPASPVTVFTPGVQLINIPFQVSGTLTGYSSTPVLNYRDDSGSFIALPAGATVSTSAFSFQHPGNLSVGNHTIGVRDSVTTANSSTTASFAVSAYTYTVSFGTASTGPWTQFGGIVNGVTDTITGLSPGVAYFFQVFTNDPSTGLQSTPVVIGPFTTSSSSAESPEATRVTAPSQSIIASQTPGTAAPSGGPFDTWSITGVGGQVTRNGITDATTAALIELFYHNHTVYQEATNSNGSLTPGWWHWNGTTWIADTSIPPGAP